MFLTIVAAIICGYLVIDALQYVAKEQQLAAYNAEMLKQQQQAECAFKYYVPSYPAENCEVVLPGKEWRRKAPPAAPVAPPPPVASESLPKKPVTYTYTCTPGVPFGKCR